MNSLHETKAQTEAHVIAQRYARRNAPHDDARYSVFNGAALAALQQRQRVMLSLMKAHGWSSLAGRHILDVGCGSGGPLLDYLRFGADPALLGGIELLPQRWAQARASLPASVSLWQADALAVPVPPQSQDLVSQFTVFSSILDESVQAALAQAMWSWVKPGGAVLWYDFTVDNPRNPDVRGVPLRRLRALFPQGGLSVRRVTLAPPLARRLPNACRAWLDWPVLRTHVLAWVAKTNEKV